jgi:hypothetical protein
LPRSCYAPNIGFSLDLSENGEYNNFIGRVHTNPLRDDFRNSAERQRTTPRAGIPAVGSWLSGSGPAMGAPRKEVIQHGQIYGEL